MIMTSNNFVAMKKFISVLSFISAFLYVAVSCRNAADEVLPGASSYHRVCVSADEESTKTTIDVDAESRSVKMSWENTGNSYVHLFENGKEGSSASIETSNNGAKATLAATFSSGLTVGSFDYNAVIAGEFSGGIPSVPATQHPAAASFDPAADILLGYSDTYYIRPHEAFQSAEITGVKMKFARVNAITRLELKGLQPGEKVDVVEIYCSEKIAGPLKPLDKYTFNGYDTNSGSNRITLEFKSDNSVAQDGTFVTYFTSWAVKPGSLSVTVATDKSMYSKTAPSQVASSLNFVRNKLGNITVSLESQELPESRFELVSGIPSSWGGTYVFVNANKAGAAKILNATSSGSGYASDATVESSGGKLFISATDAVKDLAWDISDSGKTEGGETLWNVMTGTARVILSSAKYLYDNDGITVSGSNYSGSILSRKYFYHLISADAGGVQMASYHDSKKTYLGYSGSSFAYSNDSGSRVFLYKYNDSGRESQTLSFQDDLVKWVISDGKYEIGKTYPGQSISSSSNYQKNLLSFSSSDDAVASVDSEGNVTIHKEGEVTITATASANTDYRGATASYVIRIFSPYYQKVRSKSEITNGGRYLIVSKTELLGNWYHAFCATNKDSYDYDINTLSNLLSSPILEDGERIKPSASIDANQVILDQGVLSSLTGRYTIEPVSVGKYLYCDTELTDFVSSEIKFPTYEIAFAESSGSNWLQKLEQIATANHSISIDEEGIVTITSALNNLGLGGTLFYSILQNEFSYVNLTVLENFSSVTELAEYLGQNSEYADLLKWINTLSKDISIKDLVSFFSADMYLYKYIN